MSAKIFLGRTSELTPAAVRSMLVLTIQRTTEVLNNEGVVKGAELDILPDGTWGAFLLIAGEGLDETALEVDEV
jgi:hypothetical protein